MNDILEVYDKLCFEESTSIKIDFIGRGNVWINNTYDDSVTKLAQYIILQAIIKTAPGQLSIVGFDNELSGVFAPFASLSAGENKLLELISDEKDFEKQLDYLKQQLQDVQSVIQGRSNSLLEFRKSLGRPVEGYKLVVLFIDMGLVDNDVRTKLSLLLRNGPACGISFLIISTTHITIQTSSGKDIELPVEALASNISVLSMDRNTVMYGSERTILSVVAAPEIIRECEIFSEKIKKAVLPVVLFDEIHDCSKMWTYDSIEGLTFSIGKYGVNDMEITIGDEINQRHNAVITGAVGQGKSNLISVIIHSLCLRYSPDELKMYLLDFKEGVSFKSFSNIGQNEYLPHAKALGLESDVEFGVAVLESLYNEYKRRMQILKERSARSIRELRNSDKDISMPRILVVIDEFQMMFGDDMTTGQKVADLLEKSVRLFRAAGIHFILASQTLCGNMALMHKRDSIFGQVPIRIALKNSVSESLQTLSLNNPAAAFLRPREAIVNLDYGEISQNRKTIVAFADEKYLQPIRKKWWEQARNSHCAPFVFESERRVNVVNSIEVIKELRKNDQNTPVAIVGERISVDGDHVLLPLSDEIGRNIAIIGSPDKECNQAIGIMQSVAISIALQKPKGDARFLFCDFEDKNNNFPGRYDSFNKIMENVGYFIETIPPDDFETSIKRFLESDTVNETPTYIFGISMDRWRYEKDPYGQGSVLKQFVETGPAKQYHFIGWWIKASGYTAQICGYGDSDAFNSKIFLRVDERTVQSLTTPFVKWSSHNNRALINDAVEFEKESTFIPYSPVETEDVVKFKNIVWN